VREVHAAAARLVERARNGGGPAFLLCETYRYGGHHVGDINRAYYRSRQEEQLWLTERDPILNFAGQLIEEQIIDAPGLQAIESSIKAEMAKAVEFALAAPYPIPEEAVEDVYASN
jgi:pyruvate dehydrogenase E1 component alpha subunit